MVTDLAPLRMLAGPSTAGVPGAQIDVADSPDPAWLAAFRYGEQRLPTSVKEIMTKAEHPVFVSARDPRGQTVAIARGALTPQWLGITAVEVAQHRRREGLGRLVIAALADYASTHRTRHAYLQVAQDNEPAQQLYRNLGFTRHHHYHYLRLAEAL